MTWALSGSRRLLVAAVHPLEVLAGTLVVVRHVRDALGARGVGGVIGGDRGAVVGEVLGAGLLDGATAEKDAGGEVIDLMAALKASVERSRAARGGDTAGSAAKRAPKKAKPKSTAKKAS
jgi:hypothetical protein